MKRRQIDPRPDWRARVEAQGLVFHTTPSASPKGERDNDQGVYWGEGTFYELAAAEADAIAAATTELHAMCVAAAGRVVRDGRFAELGLGPLAAELVARSWNRHEPALYGRLDLAFGPDGVPKLLEYNADTPTSLLEAAVIQWTWQTECLPGADQANALHDKLIARWHELRPRLGAHVYFACVDDLEDAMTVGYLRDTAQQAGLATSGIAVDELGWDPAREALVDLDGRAIASLFKLYPWEGLVTDTLAPALARIRVAWLEPAWKMVLSTKAILPILWELFPDHPNLLPAAAEPGRVGDAWVRKPTLGREGANVTIAAPGVSVETGGPYTGAGWIYQAYAELGEHDGMRPVIGSWLIGDAAAGIGIRETAGHVTSNTARFVPHVVG